MKRVFESNIILNKADRNFLADVSNFSVVKQRNKTTFEEQRCILLLCSG